MKKLLTIFVASLLTISCATTKPAQKHPRLNAETIQDTCEAVGDWSLRVMAMPVQVLRFQANCAGVKDLLLVVTPQPDFTTEQKRLTVRLAILYYVEFINKEQEETPRKLWRAKLIKREVYVSEDEGQKEMFYYSITSEFPPKVRK